jgi:N-acetylmuramoyl-L-alanine amidase
VRPDRIILHHAGEIDLPMLQWSAIRAYQMSWRIDYKTVSYEEYWRRKAAGEGQYFESPFHDVGYHAGTELVGSAYETILGRPWDEMGAHTIGQNGRALGLCLVGNFNLAEPPPTQLFAAARIVKLWMRIFGIPSGQIFGHKAFNDTDCPGKLFNVIDFISNYVL